MSKHHWFSSVSKNRNIKLTSIYWRVQSCPVVQCVLSPAMCGILFHLGANHFSYIYKVGMMYLVARFAVDAEVLRITNKCVIFLHFIQFFALNYKELV